MNTSEIIFWIIAGILFYTFIGYGILLGFLVRIKEHRSKKAPVQEAYTPEITLLIAAYNEMDFLHQKVSNSLSLKYPKDRIKHVWVTDGSDDGTDKELMKYANVKVLHKNERKGKTAALNRAMNEIDTEIVVFSDANTFLNEDALLEIANCFRDKNTGCVAGEKRIITNNSENAAGSGEGFYWKYESTLKNLDSRFYSAVGAAGELFAIRSELYETVPEDSLLDDFIISLRIAMKGYKIQYAPNAWASETPSKNIKEELKRKIRIAAGGFQSVFRLRKLLNPFLFPVLSFQYISHRVLRWFVTPFLLPVFFLLNMFLIDSGTIYLITGIGQIIFYLTGIIGYSISNKHIKKGALFIPFYFILMNYAMYPGLARYLNKEQSVLWERAKRA